MTVATEAARSEGGLWGGRLLEAIRTTPDQIPHLTDGYEFVDRDGDVTPILDPSAAARAAWTSLEANWADFRRRHTERINQADDEHYGRDDFTLKHWVKPLLRQLGYDLEPTPSGGLKADDKHPDEPGHPISHVHGGQVPVHVVPAGAPLDRRSPGVDGASKQSPHSVVQDYLNRTDLHLWALVANGLTIRVLRDNRSMTRQAYVEFDLAAIFDDGNYPDFALLWHTLHASRFAHDPDARPEACIAERWQEHTVETGVRALDALRDGVEGAIAELGQGLIEHQDNQALRDALADLDDPFDAQAMYRELLYVVYRHVFWFAVEDRDLLHAPDADPVAVARYRNHYSSRVLRDRARRHLGGNHPDGWEHLAVVTAAFGSTEGIEALALPPMLGRLWSTESSPHLTGTSLTNRRYFAALRRIAYVQRDGLLHRVDYRNLGADELGSVYESLLEISAVAAPSDRRFDLRRTAGSDRKSTGSYYTPNSLITVLLDEALEPVVDSVVNPQGEAPLVGEAAADAILDLTVCDPAMGSAHFLVAAAHRLARHVAAHRTGNPEPAPIEYQRALRDVVSRCIYGVDINPMATELAKISLWLESHVPGTPLTFLDHHLKTGNSLLGIGFDTSLLDWSTQAANASVTSDTGIPDAAFKALAGDDKKAATALRNRNRKLKQGMVSLAGEASPNTVGWLADRAKALRGLGDSSPEALARKEKAHQLLGQTEQYVTERTKADAWTTAWTMPKSTELAQRDTLPMDVYYRSFGGGADLFGGALDTDDWAGQFVRTEADRLGFFHWHVEYPDIASDGGFDLMLGNPPWERIKIQEKEWFSARGYDEVANAKNADARKRAIAALVASTDPIDQRTAASWQQDSRDAQATSEFTRKSQRFLYGGVGDVNTYALFADHFVESVSDRGRVGIVVPTGLVTDYTYREFFARLVDEQRLAAAYDFENKGKRIFPEVHASFRFVTLIATAAGQSPEARFAFMVHDPAELADPTRTYVLTPEQIALVNPNTKTAPVFLSPRDAEITTKIYERHPVLVDHNRPDGNPWSIRFGTMFHMANDSGLFRTGEQLKADGWSLHGNIFERGDDRMLPLYEAKFFTHFDHREKDYSKTDPDKLFVSRAYAYDFDRHEDPEAEVLPRYWVSSNDVSRVLGDRDADVLLAWSDVTAATNHRTAVASLLPPVGANHKALLAYPDGGTPAKLQLLAAWTSFAFDWIARKKISGMQLSYFVMEQLPVPAPAELTARTGWSAAALAEWVARRAAALAASSHQLASALRVETVVWNGSRRELWRTELDAAMFDIYGYSRDEVEYVMDSFPIVAKHDRKAEGLEDDDPNWRTKRLILAKYDELAKHAQDGTTYISPDEPPPLPDHLRLTADA